MTFYSSSTAISVFIDGETALWDSLDCIQGFLIFALGQGRQFEVSRTLEEDMRILTHTRNVQP